MFLNTWFLRERGQGSSKQVYLPPKNLTLLHPLLVCLCQKKINASNVCASPAITEGYSVLNFSSTVKIRWTPNEPQGK